MAKYCVNKKGEHETHKMSCLSLPKLWNRIEYDMDTDLEAMAEARRLYSDADGCVFCMSAYQRRWQ